MTLSNETKLQIKIGVQGSEMLPPEYQSFFIKWMAFNSAYNELAKGGDKQKVLKMGDLLQDKWNEIAAMAGELVSLECVGGEKIPGMGMLAPQAEVKSATLYLREILGLAVYPDPVSCHFLVCRTEKREVCDQIACTAADINSWKGKEFRALLRIIYQVRCNLVHGEKRLSGENFQANRDRELVRLSDEILGRILEWLIQ
jgi:hypothetical protein